MSLPTPYYEEPGIVIYCGDCRDILPELGEVDCLVTDPPYGVGKADWDTEFSKQWMELVSAKVVAVAPGVVNIVNMPVQIGSLPFAWMAIAAITNGMTRGALGFGNYIPLLIYSDASVFSQAKDLGSFPIDSIKPRHPSPKPLRAWRWLVSLVPGDTILDPFMGSGTTLRAAKDLGRKSIGIELESKYCDIAIRRLQQEVLPFKDPEPTPTIEQTELAYG